MEGNLTKGPIMKTLVKLAVPIMASSFLGTLYNITDMAWIGLLGSKAVAGVGVGGMFTWLSQGLASMARMGGQVQVAQCIGRGDRKKAHGFAQAAVQLAAVMGIMYAVICLVFAEQMVGFFQLEDAEAHAAALAYTKIACGLIVFSFLTLTLTGLYTAQGDSKTPFIANLIGLVMNMILDPVLILGPGPFPKFGVARGGGGNRDSAGDRHECHGRRDCRSEEGKCAERNPAFCEDPVRTSAGDLQDRDPDRASGNGVLRDFHDLNTDGVRVRRGGGRHAESRRTDRVDLLEHRGWFCGGVKRVCGAELRGRGEGTCQKGISCVALDGRALGHSGLRNIYLLPGRDRGCLFP